MAERFPHDPTRRFSNRVADYLRHRPGYPRALVESLMDEFGLLAGHVVADIGSGTGIFARMLLENGNSVYGVEPNDAMRAAAEQQLGGFTGFASVAGSGEATALPEGSVDWVMAAQAFHWLEVDKCREEFQRILRPPPQVALVWNNRKQDTPFLRDYEQLLTEHGTDFLAVRHENAETDRRIDRLFGQGGYERRVFHNEQTLDEQGLIGRTASASFMPAADHPGSTAMREALARLFARHVASGQVVLAYETVLYVGRIS